MTNLLEWGQAHLADQLKSHASIEVVYRRGAGEVTVRAVVGKTEFEIDDGAGGRLHIQSRDYLIQAADFVVANEPVLPVAGDEIRETRGNKTFVYEVLAQGGEPQYRFSDPFRKLMRVHTKHVRTEDS